MYENKSKPVISRKAFYKRILKSLLICLLLLTSALFIGMSGYHFICGLTWIDALLNASMILTGMGPVSVLADDASKIFASFYAIFSGVLFLTSIGVLLAPVLHRVMHKFHFDEEG